MKYESYISFMVNVKFSDRSVQEDGERDLNYGVTY